MPLKSIYLRSLRPAEIRQIRTARTDPAQSDHFSNNSDSDVRISLQVLIKGVETCPEQRILLRILKIFPAAIATTTRKTENFSHLLLVFILKVVTVIRT